MRDPGFPGLEIDENLPFQRKAWRAQRVAFVVLLVIVALACAGLFGTGPLSQTSREDPVSKLRVEFQRFARYSSPNAVKFEFPAGAAKDDKVSLWLSKEWVEAVQIESIAPEPEESFSDDTGYTYSFKVPDPNRPSRAILHTLPQHAGSIRAKAAIGEAGTLDFSQFVYP